MSGSDGRPGPRVVDKRGEPRADEHDSIPPTYPEVVPVLPLRDAVLFPNTALPALVGREASVKLVEQVLSGDRLLATATLRDPRHEEEPTPDDLPHIGTLGRVAEFLRLPQGGLQVALQGLTRVRFVGWESGKPFLQARIEPLASLPATREAHARMRSVLRLFAEVAEASPYIPAPFVVAAMNITDPGDLADFLSANLNMPPEMKQKLLEELDIDRRLEQVEEHLRTESELLKISSQAQEEMTEDMRRMQREQLLRRQLEVIQKELGGGEGEELAELRRRVEEAGMPEEARKAADRELARLERIPPQSPEWAVARNYLDWLIDVPWTAETPDNDDLTHARQILDEDHYGLEKIKDRIIEYLAVQKLHPQGRSPILCFVGPPGVGKTSLGQSIARALERKFVRMSLGGVRDEAEIRGHRRTYIGALPGRIVQGLRKAGTRNPVMMLDEIDKLGADFRGDPSSALLEVLDREQNHAFSDHYIEVPVDLTHVLFICTANIIDLIPPPLRDRMEVIELRGYTEPEKVAIAKQYLIPKQLAEHGLKSSQAGLTVDALRRIVREYTYEAGVRNLEREIASVFRKIATRVAMNGAAEKVTVGPSDLAEFLGPAKVRREVLEGTDEAGVATGLAWTPAGGDVLFIEAVLTEGKGRLTLTGQLGDVMKESAQAALTYARARSDAIGAPHDWYETSDLHVHVPAGAIPKDGPSAGIALGTAVVSAVSKIPVRRTTAMTGEITLRGKVLPVGGIKEKVIAAHRAGVKTVILPRDNERDLAEVPEFVRKDLRFVFAEHMDEVLREALTKPLPTLRPSETVSPAGTAALRTGRATARSRTSRGRNERVARSGRSR
ncbi:MAG: endopeptidase La [Actinomycetota bacterium]